MSVTPLQNNFIDKIGSKNVTPKDYEKIVFNNFKYKLSDKDGNDTTTYMENSNKSRWSSFKNKIIQVIKPSMKSNDETQLEVFKSSMKYVFVIGKCIGLFPIMNVTEKNVNKEYNIYSRRYLLCFIILLGEIIITSLSCYRMLSNKFSVTTLSNFLFFLVNLITNFEFIRLSTKWCKLMKAISVSNLDEYLDPYMKFKCNLAIVVSFMFCFIEHALSLLSPYIKMYECRKDISEALEKSSKISFAWIFGDILPYSHGVMVIVEFFVGTMTIIWSYSNVFLICISLYLTSILEGLNKKITSQENQLLPATYWRALRQDYNQAIRLIRFFDDTINGIVLVSLGSNLFFVCSRFYYLLVEGFVFGNNDDYSCLLRNKWYGYEDIIYNWSSSIYFIARSFIVSFSAARIHSMSLTFAPSLYSVPPSSFSIEVQRFLEQIHGTTVALTGLNFFYVTKELILSMIGTIITYELVLLQFKRDEHPK